MHYLVEKMINISLEIQPDYATISKTCNLWRNFEDIQVFHCFRLFYFK